jgi:NHLM bacteriocin system ABC transporter ATP-binding protein
MTNHFDGLDSAMPPFSIDKNKNTVLDHEDLAWIVKEGSVYVFAFVRNTDGTPGRLYYISRFEKGDIVFGTSPYQKDGKTTAFLCTGMIDTSLIKVSIGDLQKRLKSEEDLNLLYNQIHNWMEKLDKGILSPVSSVETVWTVEDETGNWIQELRSFNQSAMKRAANYLERIHKDEVERMERRYANDAVFVTNSFYQLKQIAFNDKKKKKVIRDSLEYSDNPLAAACQIVGEALQIKIKLPAKERLDQSKDVLSDIVRTSRIRFRQIILSGDWWKCDNGPLIAYLEQDRSPVALLPLAGRHYKMINPATGSEMIVKEDTAASLQPIADMLYRSLPDKALDNQDFIKFCLQGYIKKDIAYVALIGILGGIINMFIPIANGILFDEIIPKGERGQLLQMAFILGAFGISGVLFQLTRTFAMLRIESSTNASLQAAVWDRVLSLPASFFRKFTAGELAMKTMGVDQIRKYLSGAVITTILTTIFSVCNLILLFQYNPHIAWVALVLVLLSAAAIVLSGLLQMRYNREIIQITHKITGYLYQMIGGITKFRVAGAENRAFYQWAKAFAGQKKLEYKEKRTGIGVTVFYSVFPVISSMVIFYIAFQSTGLNAGRFIAFNSAFTGMITAMFALSGVMPSIYQVIPVIESMKPILQTMPEYDDRKEDPGELDGSIELSHVTFRYKPDMPAVIEDFSLKVHKGEYLALVGNSGCGKSTILRLLLGFEKPESGKIYYGGNDIENVDVRGIRKQLGVVLQNSQLMSGDIVSNIIGTNPNLNINDAIEAAKLAGLYEDIEDMPMGMYTVLSEGASTLSGGQRQRLLIARAIANKPKIIFFDEATSALDNKTQAIVTKSLGALHATRIVIAHRLSTVIDCDRIVVIDKGKIAEEGTYTQLMKNKSKFFELAKRQLA